MKRIIFVMVLLCASAYGTFGQSLYAYSSTSSQAPVKNGLAVLTIPIDARAFSSDAEVAENADTDATSAQELNYTRVIFSDSAGGNPDANPATGVLAKLWYGTFDLASSGNSVYIISIPESGFTVNNPYIAIQNDAGSGFSTIYSFQVAGGTGGALVVRPFFLEGDSGQITGSIKAQGREQPIMASGTNTLLDAEFPGTVNQLALVKLRIHGLPASSPDMYIELSSAGKVTATLSGSLITYQRVAANSNVTEVSFQLPLQFIPVTGDSGFTVSLRAKKGSAGTWSPTKGITFE